MWDWQRADSTSFKWAWKSSVNKELDFHLYLYFSFVWSRVDTASVPWPSDSSNTQAWGQLQEFLEGISARNCHSWCRTPKKLAKSHTPVYDSQQVAGMQATWIYKCDNSLTAESTKSMLCKVQTWQDIWRRRRNTTGTVKGEEQTLTRHSRHRVLNSPDEPQQHLTLKTRRA